MESLDVDGIRQKVAIDAIRSSPFQPRREFLPDELKELATSLKEVGLLHPIVVRKIEQQNRLLYYELISGERRWRAATLAGFSQIEATVVDLSDENAAKVALIENVQRVDLSPLEVAIALRKLIDIFQMSQEELAAKIGKKRSTVANYLRLLSLPEPIQIKLREGTLSMGHAKAILSLTSHELQEQLSRLIEENNLSVRATEAMSQKMVRQLKSAENAQPDQIHQIQNSLVAHLDTKVEVGINKNHKHGKIVLHFYSIDDLHRLLKTMGMDLSTT